MYEIKNSKQVELSARVRFRCIRCSKCCRNVNATVIIESYDAWRIAKHLGITVPDFYEEYTESFLLEDTGYPIFALKSVGRDNACIFLKGKQCMVQDFKPRTCKMYPFWIGPGETPDDMTYNFCSEYKHHPKGSIVKVKDWMKNNFPEDDKRFLVEDAKAMQKIAPLFNFLKHAGIESEDLLKLIIMYRYVLFETDEPFFEQHTKNNQNLVEELTKIKNSIETR